MENKKIVNERKHTDTYTIPLLSTFPNPLHTFPTSTPYQIFPSTPFRSSASSTTITNLNSETRAMTTWATSPSSQSATHIFGHTVRRFQDLEGKGSRRGFRRVGVVIFVLEGVDSRRGTPACFCFLGTGVICSFRRPSTESSMTIPITPLQIPLLFKNQKSRIRIHTLHPHLHLLVHCLPLPLDWSFPSSSSSLHPLRIILLDWSRLGIGSSGGRSTSHLGNTSIYAIFILQRPLFLSHNRVNSQFGLVQRG